MIDRFLDLADRLEASAAAKDVEAAKLYSFDDEYPVLKAEAEGLREAAMKIRVEIAAVEDGPQGGEP